VQTTGNALVPQAGAASGSLPAAVLAMSADATIQAGVQTLIGGGRFLDRLRDGLVQDAAAAVAYGIGDTTSPYSIQNVLEHAALGCASGAATGQGCGGGAIGGAVSAMMANSIATAVTGGQGVTDQG